MVSTNKENVVIMCSEYFVVWFKHYTTVHFTNNYVKVLCNSCLFITFCECSLNLQNSQQNVYSYGVSHVFCIIFA